jgi:hypothetical protein
MNLIFGHNPTKTMTLPGTEVSDDFCLVPEYAPNNPMATPEPSDESTGQVTADFWDDAEVISCYTRKQAIEDGVLVDLTEWAGPSGMTGGFTIPVAVTASVWSDIENIPTSKSFQDVRGRAHYLLWMAACAGRNAKSSTLCFTVLMDLTRTRKRTQTYKMVIGPGDDAEPVITIMQVDED